MTSGIGIIEILTEDFGAVLQKYSDKSPLTIWIMGGDGALRLAVQSSLPDGASLGDWGPRLDQAAERLTQELINLDEQVVGDERQREVWRASVISDRSPYVGALQVNASRYFAMEEIIATGGRHLFFVGDALTAEAFATTARLNRLAVTWSGHEYLRADLRKTIRARLSALKTHWQQARVLKKMRKTMPAPWAGLRECDVLLVDWAGARDFNPDGETLCAGYLRRTVRVLREAGFRVGFVAIPLSWSQPFKQIADNVVRAHDPVVMVDDCRSLFSVIRSAWKTWALGRKLKVANPTLQGKNVGPLFQLERIQDQHRAQSTLAYAFGDVPKALASHGVAPKVILYPFENQGWEHALLDGVRSHLPQTRAVACQQAPFASRYISFFPAQSDVLAGRVADHLLVMGEWYRRLFIQHGWPENDVSVCGSLRFETALEHPPHRCKHAKKVVLAATSIDFFETVDLVMKAVQAVRNLDDAKLVINFHPVTDNVFREQVESVAVGVLGDASAIEFECSLESVSELIKATDVLLYNNSGAVFDAFFAGVPSVHVAVDGEVNYDKVPGGSRYQVRDGKELEQVLLSIFDAPEEIKADMSVKGSVSPVNENAIVGGVQGG